MNIKIIAAAAIVASVLVTGCKKKAEAPPQGAGQMPPALVVTALAKSQDVPVYIDQIGKAMAMESVTITPRIDGQIVKKHFDDGAEIKAGQLLFSIDPAPFEATLAAANAQLGQAKAAANLANIELERYSQVAGTNAISKSDYDTRKNAVDVANAAVALAEANLKTAQLNLDYTTVKSPIDGRAGSRMVDVGNIVKENETALLSVQNLDPIYADFTINESQLPTVQDHMKDGTLKAIVRLPTDAMSEPGTEGELTFLDNSVQSGSGTVRLRGTIPNKQRHFWPGQFVNVRLILRVDKSSVLVPNSAPQMSQTGAFLYVVGNDNAAEMRIVQTGQSQGDWIVIDKGLAAGEKVITDGQMMVRPGGHVRENPGAASQPTPGANPNSPTQGKAEPTAFPNTGATPQSGANPSGQQQPQKGVE